MKRQPHNRTASARRGSVYVIVLILMLLLSSLAIAIIHSAGAGVLKSEGHRDILGARVVAESGVSYLSLLIRNYSPPSGAGAEEVLEDLADYLGDQLNGGSAVVSGQVSYADGVLYLPEMAFDDQAGRFTANIALDETYAMKLSVTGQQDQTTRTIGLGFSLSGGGSGIFDHGIVTGGPLKMTGNARLRGANDVSEATVLSITAANQVFQLTGNANLEGDLYATNTSGYAQMSGNVCVGGVRHSDPDIADHLHFDNPPVELPRPDPSVFEPFAVNTLSGSTSGNRTFTNIRIPAGANPTFSGNITLKGVIFIEVPNKVKFSGNLNIQGVVVTQDAGSDNYDDNSLKFTGNTSFQGVETLPADEFPVLRTMPGAQILAPGFDAQFSGNFGTVGGAIVAEKFKFTGNAGGTIKGSLVSYGDEELSITGNANFTFDRSEYDAVPPGFSGGATTLTPTASSYFEE